MKGIDEIVGGLDIIGEPDKGRSTRRRRAQGRKKGDLALLNQRSPRSMRVIPREHGVVSICRGLPW
jgi:hypothetical protein